MCDCDRVRAQFNRPEMRCCEGCHERDEMSHIRTKPLGLLRLCCHTLAVVVDLRNADALDIDPEDPPSFMMRAAGALPASPPSMPRL